MKTFLMISGSILLAFSCVTASDARSHANRRAPTQGEPSYYDQERGRDSSCFSRSTGLPDQYACTSNGG